MVSRRTLLAGVVGAVLVRPARKPPPKPPPDRSIYVDTYSDAY